MNRNQKSASAEIEARLERSLRSQVRVPKLDRRFDAAVWARIEQEKAKAVAPLPAAKSAASRWLLASNLAGALVATVLVCFFWAQMLLSGDVSVPIPQVPQGLVERMVGAMIWPVTIIAIGSGLMFTSLGRRLREELF